MQLDEPVADRVPPPVGVRGPAVTPGPPRPSGRGPRWSQPARPDLTRLVATPLLLSGSVLLGVVVLVLPPAVGPGLGWGLAGALLVHASVVWLVPVRTRAGDLAAATAALTAVGVVTVSTVLVGAGLHAWSILLGLPVLYAASMFGRVIAVVVTALTCAGATAVLLLTGTSGAGVSFAVDVLLVCGCLVILAVFVVHGIEHMAALVAELERVVAVDGLTGLVTRRVLDDAMAASLTTARSATGTALVLVDLDHFKSVNDEHGHPVGDAVLQHVGAVLSASVRGSDAVVSRVGGDELAVLLPGCPVEVAARRADDLVHAVRDTPLVLPDGTALRLTVSVGVAHAPEHAVDVRSLYAVADAALYAAKRAGRDGFALAGTPVHRG